VISFSELLAKTLEATSLSCTRKAVGLYESDLHFFSERVVNVWNSLQASVDFSSFHSFKRTVKLTDFSAFLGCFNVLIYKLSCLCLTVCFVFNLIFNFWQLLEHFIVPFCHVRLTY